MKTERKGPHSGNTKQEENDNRKNVYSHNKQALSQKE